MNNQKIENLLNLSLNVTEEEREKSEALSIGFDESTKKWEIILRHTLDLSRVLRDIPDISSYVELSGGYATMWLSEKSINQLADYEEVEFIEKPKGFYFAVDTGRSTSCLSLPQQEISRGGYGLTGRGIIFACIDSGIDYTHPDFRNEDGTTRILAIWDQSDNRGNPPEGFVSGTEYTREQIDQALQMPTRNEQLKLVPVTDDASGHGTAVAGIGAGNGLGSAGRKYRGVAYESELIVVKLGLAGQSDFPRTTQVMQGIEYVMKKALQFAKPVVINLSFGNNYGAHDGTSLLETYIDNMASQWKSSIVVGSGNEGDTARHAQGTLAAGTQTVEEFSVGDYEKSISLQIWKQYFDLMDIFLEAPDGSRFFLNVRNQYILRYHIGKTDILVYSGEPTPYSIDQEIFVELIPSGQQEFINGGIWKVVFMPSQIISGRYNLWLPSGIAAGRESRFLTPSLNTTLTIPSVAHKAISVAAYNQNTLTATSYSGRGFGAGGQLKPDIAAPGQDIMTAAPGGGYARRTGTSMATPFVSGSAALLMQWGIVEGNSPYLYGEKLKAYLLSGARPLQGIEQYPNPLIGYGTLCVGNSIPK